MGGVLQERGRRLREREGGVTHHLQVHITAEVEAPLRLVGAVLAHAVI
jgi:hypothetical protein